MQRVRDRDRRAVVISVRAGWLRRDARQSGWWRFGGTSASSPMWAARSADSGAVVNAGYVCGNSISYRDITSGNNGAPCLVGYDLCTGRGSWTGATS